MEPSEQFVRVEIEGGQAVDGGAQPAHGGDGTQPRVIDISHDECHARARERDDVEPGAGAAAAGAVPLGDFDGPLRDLLLAQGPALQRRHHDVLPGEPQGVLQAGHRTGGHAVDEIEVFGPVRLGPRRAVEGDSTEDLAANGQRRRDPGTGESSFSGRCEQEGLRRQIVSEQAGQQDGSRLRNGQVPARAPGRRAAQERNGVLCLQAGFLSPQNGVGEGDDGPVGEARHRHVDEFPGRALHVEAGADPFAGAVQQSKPGLCTFAFGHVRARDDHAEYIPRVILEAVDGDREDPPAAGVGRRKARDESFDHRASRGEDLAQYVLVDTDPGRGVHLRRRHPDHAVRLEAEQADGGGVHADDAQMRVQDVESHVGLREDGFEDGLVPHTPTAVLRVGGDRFRSAEVPRTVAAPLLAGHFGVSVHPSLHPSRRADTGTGPDPSRSKRRSGRIARIGRSARALLPVVARRGWAMRLPLRGADGGRPDAALIPSLARGGRLGRAGRTVRVIRGGRQEASFRRRRRRGFRGT